MKRQPVLSSFSMSEETVTFTSRRWASNVKKVAAENAVKVMPVLPRGFSFHLTGFVPLWHAGFDFAVMETSLKVFPIHKPLWIGWRSPDCHSTDPMYSN